MTDPVKESLDNKKPPPVPAGDPARQQKKVPPPLPSDFGSKPARYATLPGLEVKSKKPPPVPVPTQRRSPHYDLPSPPPGFEEGGGFFKKPDSPRPDLNIPFQTHYSLSALSERDKEPAREREDSDDLPSSSPGRTRPKKPPPRPPPDQKPFMSPPSSGSPKSPGFRSPLPPEPQSPTQGKQFHTEDWLKKEKELVENFYHEHDFWRSLETMQKSADSFSQEVQAQMEFFASRSVLEDDTQMHQVKLGYQNYGRFLSSYVTSDWAHQHIEEFRNLADLLAQLDDNKNALAIKLDQRLTAFKGLVHNLESAKAEKKRYKESKHAYSRDLKAYLGLKTTEDPSKLDELDVERSGEKRKLELRRFDLDSKIRHEHLGRELKMLKHLTGVLMAYSSFFQQGVDLMKPVKAQIDAINEHIKSVVGTVSDDVKFRKSVRKKIQAKLDQEADRNLKRTTPSLGIRDLDRTEATTSDTEAFGYLYFPPPAFATVWATLKDGYLNLQRQNKPEENIPMFLCTVKENREKNLRFVFSVISPSKTVHLQAENFTEMQKWITVIQNAISSSLNSQRRPSEMKEDKKEDGLPSEELKSLWSIEGNNECVDCGKEDPTWVSINLGVLMCMTCSGHHRNLGVHISKVRSATLDKLDPLSLMFLLNIGNRCFNAVFESEKLIEEQELKKLKPDAAMQVREVWINHKYRDKSFCESKGHLNETQLDELLWDSILQKDYMAVLTAIVLGARVNCSIHKDGQTPLHEAVKNQDGPMIELLLKNGADVMTRNNQGMAPLHFAVLLDDARCVGHLILRGGSHQITIKDAEGKTPLEIVREKWGEKAECLTVLEEAREKVDKKLRENIVRSNFKELQQVQAKAQGLPKTHKHLRQRIKSLFIKRLHGDGGTSDIPKEPP